MDLGTIRNRALIGFRAYFAEDYATASDSFLAALLYLERQNDQHTPYYENVFEGYSKALQARGRERQLRTFSDGR